MPFSALLALLSLSVVVSADQYRLYHRLYHPGETQQPHFQERGTLSISPNNTLAFEFAPTFAVDISSFAEDLNEVKNKHLLLYQVALERERDEKEEHWDISSVKACHLAGSTSEQIYLHAIDTHGLKPYAINYFVSPIPHDGTCPKSRSKKATTKNVSRFESFANVNTSVSLKASHFPPLPQLASPPPITPDGQPAVPVPEKTFLQKYWMYIAAFMLATLLAGGGEEEKPVRRE